MDDTLPGLTSPEAASRLARYGPNRLPEKPPPSDLEHIVAQVRNPLIIVLVLAAVFSIGFAKWIDGAMIGFAIAVNVILGFLQERKASRALFALKRFITRMVSVVRDGNRMELDAESLVPGDVVYLTAGLTIPADGMLHSSHRLTVSESILTGESSPVHKKAGSDVFMGTTVTTGTGVMEIKTTGATTKMGAIASSLETPDPVTPLQRSITRFSRNILTVIIILCAVVIFFGELAGLPQYDIFQTAVSLAVASIPEGLVVSLTVVLAVGMQRILKRRGLVKRMSSAETLGAVTVICIDKTGTLTTGQLAVTDVIGDNPTLARHVTFANDRDDPLLTALFDWAKSTDDPPDNRKRLDSIPFTSEHRLSASLLESPEHHRLVILGAPESVLSRCILSESERHSHEKQLSSLAADGKRVVALASRYVPYEQTQLSDSDLHHRDFTLTGLVAFADPVRTSVGHALAEAKRAGIRILVITGDFAPTAMAVLRELGAGLTETDVLTGAELAGMSDETLSHALSRVQLIARATPQDKLRIVKLLQASGETVAMMGDGVNDAPAIHAADIGIVVGAASDVARETADLVLLDSDFATIVAAVEEGRVIYDNIRKIILYLLSDAFSQIIIVIGSIIIGLPLPLTPVLILWMNLISDAFPSAALTVDPKRTGIMHEPPRRKTESLVTSWMVGLVAVMSAVSGLISLAFFAAVYFKTGDAVLAKSVVFVTLGLQSLVYIFPVRSLLEPVWRQHSGSNPYLFLAIAVAGLLIAIPFVTPATRQFFGVVPLAPHQWGVAIGLAVSLGVSFELWKAIVRRGHRRHQHRTYRAALEDTHG